MFNPLGIITWHIVEGVVLPAAEEMLTTSAAESTRPEGPEQCPFRNQPLFGKVSDYTRRLKNRPKGSVSIEGVRHVPQRGNHGRFVCRHAVLKSIRRFLKEIKGLSDRQVRALKLYNVVNNTVTTMKGEWPWRYGDVLCPTTAQLKKVMDIIDSHLDNGLPAMIYVRHSRDEHVVEVKGRIAREDGTYEYIFYDPGTRHKDKCEGRLVFDETSGTYIKKGSMRRKGEVVNKQYALFGVFDYQSRIEDAINPRVAKK